MGPRGGSPGRGQNSAARCPRAGSGGRGRRFGKRPEARGSARQRAIWVRSLGGLRHTRWSFMRPVSWPEVGGTRENFRGALGASPPRITLPERTDSHRTVMSGQTISPSRPRAREGAPRTRAMTDAHGTVAPFGGSGGSSPRGGSRAMAKAPRGRRRQRDAGWLRGQTTRRRNHRRSDGGPERRQVLRRGTRAPVRMLLRNPPWRIKPRYKTGARTVRDRCRSTQRERRWRSHREQSLSGCLEFHSWPGRAG
jgi:hypothetical protein